MKKITAEILKITNNSDYRCLSIDSHDAEKINDFLKNSCFDIEFVMYLTGHDKETIEQMAKDFYKYK